MKQIKLTILPLFILIVSVISFSAKADLLTDEYQEGVSYQVIIPEQPTSSKEKIEIVGLFWYGCPHCHRFEPHIERWLESKADYIEYVRLPAIFRPDWAIHSRAFYVAEALDVVEDIHLPLFTAIHAHKRKLNTQAALAEFFEENGVDKKLFNKAFRSFGVEAKVRQSREMGRRYGLTGTPGIVINGKYRVDGNICKCGFSEMLKITDFLANKENENRS
ncbi:Periplasmic thiol:disulfide interchange protein DsbA [hydrothermal vent metagenome]|uniref:Thiol:disulfide interchange protein DsbA n=1 Tax=hydrothermal vent metagenome TaxID=652676 RepID=A0A3B0ZJB9_9ZZZZ